MKYVNANAILPNMLIEELQKYVQAGYIYIPAKNEQHKSWGELSGSRKEINKRNKIIIEKYRNGVSVDELAEEYCLSKHRLGAGGQARQTLDLAGNDDLCGLAVGHFLHGLQGLQLHHLVVGGGGVQKPQGLRQGGLDPRDGLGLRLGGHTPSMIAA